MATLYRCPVPTNVLCPCGRVARALDRRGIAHDEVRVPLRKRDRPEIEALTGQRHVPVLVLDGTAICDSRRIVEHLAWRDAEAASSAEAGRQAAPAGDAEAGRPAAPTEDAEAGAQA